MYDDLGGSPQEGEATTRKGVRKLGGYSCVIWAVAGLSAWGCPGQEELARQSEKRATKRADAIKEVAQWHKQVGALVAAVPTVDSLVEKKCPDDKIREAIEETPLFTGYFRVGEREYLRWLSSGGPEQGRTQAHRWRWLGSLAKVRPLSELTDEEAGSSALDQRTKDSVKWVRIFNKRARYFALIVRVGGQMPVVQDEGRYTGGHLDGWVVVMDVGAQEPVCQVRFSARSSKRVKLREGKVVSDEYKFKKAVQKDFEDSVKRAAKQSVRKISPVFVLKWAR